MKTFYISITALVLLLANFRLICKNYYYEDAGVELLYPNDWNLEYAVDEEKFLYAYSPDEDFTLLATVLKEDSLESALEYIESTLSLDYLSVDIFEKDSIRINGLYAIKGEGKLMIDDDTDNTIKFVLVALPERKVLYLYGIDYPDIIDNYRKNIEKIIKSIRIKNK